MNQTAVRIAELKAKSHLTLAEAREALAGMKQVIKGKPSLPRRRGPRQGLYISWRDMIARCSDPRRPSFNRYGGRGITVCPEWKDFRAFERDMAGSWQQGLTLDRVENEEGYNKANCRWLTKKQNAEKISQDKKKLLLALQMEAEDELIG